MKKLSISAFLKGRIRQTAVIACAILLSGAAWTQADSTSFSRIIAFGDSLTDTGNLYRLTGGYPPRPYFEGRFSNGQLWAEYLATDLGMQLRSEDNYAVGGATTGSFNINDLRFGLPLPGLQDEIARFLASIQSHGADPDALYLLWAGANDFFVALTTGDPAGQLTESIANTILAIQQLSTAGAQHILVPNLPDLGLTPDGQATGHSGLITGLSAQYNDALADALQDLARHGIPTIQVDAFATLRAMVISPDAFGFTNVTAPLRDVLLAGGHPNPEEFLFWDWDHPTTHGHRVLADAARNRLIDFFSPRQGKGVPPGSVNSLNGLVHAGKGH